MNASLISLIEEINQAVQLPIKFIYVTRNPFDNIATMMLRETGTRDAVREEGVEVRTRTYEVFHISYSIQIKGTVSR